MSGKLSSHMEEFRRLQQKQFKHQGLFLTTPVATAASCSMAQAEDGLNSPPPPPPPLPSSRSCLIVGQRTQSSDSRIAVAGYEKNDAESSTPHSVSDAAPTHSGSSIRKQQDPFGRLTPLLCRSLRSQDAEGRVLSSTARSCTETPALTTTLTTITTPTNAFTEGENKKKRGLYDPKHLQQQQSHQQFDDTLHYSQDYDEFEDVSLGTTDGWSPAVAESFVVSHHPLMQQQRAEFFANSPSSQMNSRFSSMNHGALTSTTEATAAAAAALTANASPSGTATLPTHDHEMEEVDANTVEHPYRFSSHQSPVQEDASVTLFLDTSLLSLSPDRNIPDNDSGRRKVGDDINSSAVVWRKDGSLFQSPAPPAMMMSSASTSRRKAPPPLDLPVEDWNDDDASVDDDRTGDSKTEPVRSKITRASELINQRLDSGLKTIALSPIVAAKITTPIPSRLGEATTFYTSLLPPRPTPPPISSYPPVTPSSRDNIPPPETLWVRNKTLVQEVRFADQTCVELSARNRSLEDQILWLHQQHDEDRKLLFLAQQQQQQQHAHHSQPEPTALETAPNESNMLRVQVEALQQQCTLLENERTLWLSEKTSSALPVIQEEETDRIAQIEALNLELSQSTCDLKQVLADTMSELTLSKNTLEQALIQDSQLRERISQLESIVQEQKDSVSTQQQILDEMRTSKQQLESTVSHLNEDLQTHLRRISELEQRCTELLSISTMQGAQFTDLVIAKHLVDTKLCEAEEKSKRLEEQRDDLHKSKTVAETQCAELLERITELGSHNEMLHHEKERFETEKEEILLSVKANALNRLQFDSTNEELSNLHHQVENLKGEGSSLKESKLCLEAQLNLSREELATRTQELVQVKVTAAHVPILQARVKELESSKSFANAVVVQLEEKLARCQDELKVKSMEVVELQTGSACLRDQITELEEQNSSLLELKESLETDLEQARKDDVATSIDLQNAHSVINELKASHSTEISGLVSRIAETESKLIISLQSTVLDLDQRATTLENVMAQTTNNMIARLSNAENDLQFVQESTDFQAYSQKGEDTPVLREVCESSLHPSSADECLNATIGSLNAKSGDLNLMEEARFDVASDDRSKPRALSDVTDEEEIGSLSSSEGISHMFENNDGNDLSLSVSDHRAERKTPFELNIEQGGVKNMAMERERVDLVRRIEDLEACNFQLEAEFKSATVQLDKSMSLLALVRSERDSLQLLVNENSDINSSQISMASNSPPDSSDLQDRLAVLEDRVTELQAVNDSMSVERNLLLHQVKILKSEKEDVSRKFSEASNECHAFQTCISKLEKSLFTAREDFEAFQSSSREDAKKKMEHHQQTIDALTLQLSESIEKQSVFREEMDLAVNIRISLEEKVQEESKQRKQLVEGYTLLQNESSKHLEALREELTLLSREKEDVSAEVGAMVACNEKMKNECSRLREELSSKANENEMFAVDLGSLRIQLADILHKYNETQIALGETKQLLSVAQKEAAVTQCRLEEHKHLLLSLTTTRDELSSAVSALRREKEAWEKENVALKSDVSAKSMELDRAHELCGILRAASEQAASDHLEHVRRSNSESERFRQASERSLDKVEKNCQAVERSLVDSESLRKELERSLQVCRERNEAMEMSLKEKDSDIAMYREKLSTAEEYANHHQGLATHAERRWTDFQSELGRVQVERNDALAKCLVLEEKLKSEAQANWSLQSNLQQILESRDAATRQLAALTEEVDRMREEMAELEQQLETIEAALTRSVEEKENVQSNQMQLQGKYQDLRQYTRKLMRKCEEWEAHCSEQSNAFVSLRGAHDMIQKMILDRDQQYNHERSLWTTERSNLSLMRHTLEEEMEEIARELVDYNCPPE